MTIKSDKLRGVCNVCYRAFDWQELLFCGALDGSWALVVVCVDCSQKTAL